jgi:hypothetical protein
MEAMVKYAVKAIRAVRRDKRIKAIDVRSDVQSDYVAAMKKNLKLTVWQTDQCSAFHRKNMTGEVTSLSPESVVHFIFSRKWFRLRDYHLLTYPQGASVSASGSVVPALRNFSRLTQGCERKRTHLQGRSKRFRPFFRNIKGLQGRAPLAQIGG